MTMIKAAWRWWRSLWLMSQGECPGCPFCKLDEKDWK